MRGLRLSNSKTKIVNIKEGFTFLSRFYYEKDGNIHAVPAKKAVQKLEQELYDLILVENKYSQKSLIQKLNAKLNGWASYHRITEVKETFVHIDVYVSMLLLKLLKRMYPEKTTKALVKKYWYKDIYGRNVFALTTNKSIRVIKLEDVILVEQKRLDIKKNYILDSSYFEERKKVQEIEKISGRYKKIWLQQEGICYYCKNLFNRKK